MDHRENFNEISEKIFFLLGKKGVTSSEVYYGASKLLTISSEEGKVEDINPPPFFLLTNRQNRTKLIYNIKVPETT